MIRRVAILAAFVCIQPALLFPAQPQPLSGFDEYVAQVMSEFKIPGIAIAVVDHGRIVLAKGYGFRDAENRLPVTTKTLFPIASITKSFTVSTLGMLVTDGKLDWDQPVRNSLPWFRMFDPVATDQLTPRDLVTHRSGLPRHDLIWFSSNFSRRELVEKLRYLEPNKPIRQTFQYNNLMFITAGFLAGELSHSTWEETVRSRILMPLGMTSTVFTSADARKTADYAMPYRKNYKTEEVKRIDFADWGDVGPAGAINSNVDDLGRYLLFHLNQGTIDGKMLLSANNAAQMQTPQMVIQGSPDYPELGERSYGMGFFISSYRGHKLVEHGGNLDGFSLNLAFLPGSQIGVVVLTNLSQNAVRDFIPYNVFDRFLGLDQVPWDQRQLAVEKKDHESQVIAENKGFTGQKQGTRYSHALTDYVGEFTHPAYGSVTIAPADQGAELKLTLNRLSRPLHHFHYDTFSVAPDPLDPIEQLKVSFLTDLNGEISSLSIPLEPSVSPIVFTRAPEKRMFETTFLRQFTGEYELPGAIMTVSLQGQNQLVASRPGRPVDLLTPKHGTTFEIQSFPGQTFEFRPSEVVRYTPDGVYVFKKK